MGSRIVFSVGLANEADEGSLIYIVEEGEPKVAVDRSMEGFGAVCYQGGIGVRGVLKTMNVKGFEAKIMQIIKGTFCLRMMKSNVLSEVDICEPFVCPERRERIALRGRRWQDFRGLAFMRRRCTSKSM